MSLPVISARPGGRSLAAYHRERALLYSVLGELLDPEVSSPDPGALGGRLAGLRQSLHRARPLVDGLLTEPGLVDQRRRFLLATDITAAELEALEAFALRSRECARALEDGDVASAADLWDAQSREVSGGSGRRLIAAADRLRNSGAGALVKLGMALRCLVEEDIVFAALGPQA